MNAPRLALAAAAAVGVQVGAAIVGTRALVDELGPASIAFVRYAVALASLLPFVDWRAVQAIDRRDRVPAMLLGIGQFALLIALLNLGLQSVPAAPAALIFASFPLLALGVAAVLGHERLSVRKLYAVALTLAGVAVALGPGVAARGAWWGEFAVLASALTGAVCSVLYRPYLRRHPLLPLTVWALGAAVASLALGTWLEGGFMRLPHVSAAGWGALIAIGASSGIGYWLWLWALRHADASRVTLYLALSPLTALLLGTVVLGESVPARLWLALALVGAGLWATRTPGAPAATSAGG